MVWGKSTDQDGMARTAYIRSFFHLLSGHAKPVCAYGDITSEEQIFVNKLNSEAVVQVTDFRNLH